MSAEVFSEDGLSIIDLPDQVLDLKAGVLREMSAWLAEVTGETVAPENLAKSLPNLADDGHREAIGTLYRISRRFPSVKQLASHPFFVELSQNLMGAQLVSCCNFVCVRIDMPGEDDFLLGPHQDFHYIQGSPDGITFWTPLNAVPIEMGPPSFVVGSHRNGVLPVRERSLEETYGSNGGSTIELAALADWEAKQYWSRSISESEAAVFSTLLVHQSGVNRTDQARISMQLRFDNLLDPVSRAKGYPEGLYLRNAFSDSYPEYVER